MQLKQNSKVDIQGFGNKLKHYIKAIISRHFYYTTCSTLLCSIHH